MVRIPRPFVAAASLALLFVLPGGCSSGKAPSTPAGGVEAPPARGGSLVASIRSDPRSYNRLSLSGSNGGTELVTLLTQARLVRIDRTTGVLEPWLAERWEAAPDGRRYTLHLRRGLTFSDGAPFSAEDVLFTFKAAYDPQQGGTLGETLMVEGKPLAVEAPDPHTVVVTFPGPSGPGLRLLDNLPILPAHRLRAALDGGSMNDEWTPARPLSDVAGLGPFVLREHVAGQRLVFDRNERYFRQDAHGVRLPYLDRLTVLVIRDQAAESLRLQGGETDLLSSAMLRPQDQAPFLALQERGTARILDIGYALDADMLWFNLSASGAADAPYRQTAFRQAVSAAIDRQAIADTVYLGAATPVAGPTTPGNTTWFAPDLPAPVHDPTRARMLLAGLGYRDRDGDGLLETADGRPVRFSLLAQAGHLRGGVATMIREQLRQVGIEVKLASLDSSGLQSRVGSGDYEAAYYGIDSSSPDPVMNQEFWLSRGQMHVWHPQQPTPATPWEARIDALMHEQATATSLPERQRAFAEVQRIMIEQAPAIFLVAPRIVTAVSSRVRHVAPAAQTPQLLWSADTLAVAR